MAGKALGLVVICVLLVGALTGILYDTTANAKPASKSPKHKYCKWSKHICGDELCPGHNYVKTERHIGKSHTSG